MRQGRRRISVTPGFCIAMAICLCILPLKWIVCWFLAVTVHELCHCAAAIACGTEIQSVSVSFFGAQIVARPNTAWKEIVCSLAGPIGGLLLLFLHRIMPITALCAFVHAAYNLLPLKHLDGGSAISALMRMIFKKERADSMSKFIDKATRIILFGIGLYFSYSIKWGALALFSVLLLFGKSETIKSSCKRKGLQVQ